MAMHVESLTFGLGTLKLYQATNASCFAGQQAEQTESGESKAVYDTVNIEPLWLGKSKAVELDYQTKDGDVDSISIGGLKGNFTDRYHFRVYVYEKLVGATKVTLTLLSKQNPTVVKNTSGVITSSGISDEADVLFSFEMGVDEFNSHYMSGKPIEVSLPSTVKNALILKVDCGAKPSAGIIKACIEPKAW